MNRVAITILSLFFCLGAAFISVEDAKTQAFLDKYYARVSQFRSAQMAYVLSKHPEWKDAMDHWLTAYEANDALSRRMFVYHQQKKPDELRWNEGNWWLSIAVCNCGEKALVRVVGVDQLIEARGKAEMAFRRILGQFDAYNKVLEVLRDAPDLQDDMILLKLTDLKEEFDDLLKRPSQAPRPAPATITPSTKQKAN